MRKRTGCPQGNQSATVKNSLEKFLLLDRDGVINKDRPDSVLAIDQFEILPGVCDALGSLTRSGYRTLVITNQACVGRKALSSHALEDIHRHLQACLAAAGGRIDEFFICTHAAEEGCFCRKPKPGLIFQAMKQWRFVAAETWFVGDARRDIEAARSAGCLAALVRTGKGEQTEAEVVGVPVFDDLPAFVNHLLDNGGVQE